MSEMSGCAPEAGQGGEKDKDKRPDSGVCLSPSERSHDAVFYISQSSETRDPDSDRFGTFERTDDSSDDLESENGNEPSTIRTPASKPLQIPGASSFHRAQDEAIQLMHSTPPRSYNTHPLAELYPDPDLNTPAESGLACRYSTGCLTNMPVIIQALSVRSSQPYRDFLMTGFRVTSNHLQASNRRVDLHRKRTISERVSSDDVTVPRDRSLSAPNIGLQRQLVQRQCGQELRKISDEFFQEFHQRKGRSSRPGQSEPAHSSSYPGTSGTEHGLWQAIIQSFSPARLRSSTSSSELSSLPPVVGEPRTDRRTNPRIVVTKQTSGEKR